MMKMSPKKLLLRVAALLTVTACVIGFSGCYQSKKRDYDKAKFKYSVNKDDTVTITGVDDGGNEMNGIKVPRTIEGKTVTVIGKSAFSEGEMVGGDEKYLIVLPDTITKIEEYAFSHSSIKVITIPDSVVEIEEGAFSGVKLESVIVPKDTKIAEKAFSDSVKIIRK